jgi:hypothetical protein
VTTRIHRNGNYLNVTFIINDPAYLTEPYIREYSLGLYSRPGDCSVPVRNYSGWDHPADGERAQFSAWEELHSLQLCH